MKLRVKNLSKQKKYQKISQTITPKIWIGAVVIFLFAVGLAYVFPFIVASMKTVASAIATNTIQAAANTAGEPLKQDEYGHINVLIVGYGGTAEGTYLTDTMMLASYDSKKKSMSMVSIPRDLWVKYDNGGQGKINAIFSDSYLRLSKRSKEFDPSAFDAASMTLSEKIKDITGIMPNYYVFVDFNGFVKLVDSLGGVDVHLDEDFVDTQYPTWDYNGYMTFSLKAGDHVLDGNKALMFARSRHSTSDFSRAARQQQIIKSLVKRSVNQGLNNVNKIKDYYGEFQSTIKTNISLKQMIWLSQFHDDLDHFLSFVISDQCTKNWKQVTPGCYLYTPAREQFGGASVLLPVGSSAVNLSNYKYIQDFVTKVVLFPEYLIENPPITLINSTSPKKVKVTVLDNLAYDLKNNGFNLVNVQKIKTVSENSILYVSETEKYKNTIDMLKQYANFQVSTTIPEEYTQYGEGIILVAGNDIQ